MPVIVCVLALANSESEMLGFCSMAATAGFSFACKDDATAVKGGLTDLPGPFELTVSVCLDTWLRFDFVRERKTGGIGFFLIKVSLERLRLLFDREASDMDGRFELLLVCVADA